MSEIKRSAASAGKYFRTFYRWVLLASAVGAVCGLVGAAFNLSVSWATGLRETSPRLLYLLPLGGLFIAAGYRLTKTEGEGTNNIIDSIHAGEKVHILLVPVIFVSTAVTHLFGGSAGREGAALQIGGGIGFNIGRLLKLDDKDMRIITLAGMSAVFSALFGTPLTATVFAIEVISVGILHYSAFLPCITASIAAYGVSMLFGVAPMRFGLVMLDFSGGTLLRVCILALVCALVSIIFCVALHKTELFASKALKSPYLRAFVGGLLIILLSLSLGTRVYNGIGTGLIASALSGEGVPSAAFLWKIVFTAITIGFGFKGGEIVPTFFIGATLGAFLGPLLGLPSGFAAAIALVAVFCGCVNCPLASVILSVELFGSGDIIYFAAACAISYMLSGYFGLYSSQKIIYSKTRTEYIDRHAS